MDFTKQIVEIVKTAIALLCILTFNCERKVKKTKVVPFKLQGMRKTPLTEPPK